MATYGIDAERAFEVLVWRSQETNVKLRDLAGRFLAAMTETIPAYTRSEVDYILLTCHDPSRMRPGADRR
jgi:hypothetical protein